jgi:hypothetical protein
VGEVTNVYTILVRKPEGKRSHGRPRHRWEDNIRMDLGVNYELVASGSGYKAVAGCCEHGNETSGSIKGGGIS